MVFVVYFSENSCVRCVTPSVIMTGSVVRAAAFMFLKPFALNKNWILSNV